MLLYDLHITNSNKEVSDDILIAVLGIFAKRDHLLYVDSSTNQPLVEHGVKILSFSVIVGKLHYRIDECRH